jgi:putative endopeptidase
MTVEEAGDISAWYNPTSLSRFDRKVKAFDFAAIFEKLLGQVPETICPAEPDYFTNFDKLVNDETFDNLKSWMIVKTVYGLSYFCSYEMYAESCYYDYMYLGGPEPVDEKWLAYYSATDMFGDVPGLYYGQTYFGQDAKEEVRHMANAIIEGNQGRDAAGAAAQEEIDTAEEEAEEAKQY